MNEIYEQRDIIPKYLIFLVTLFLISYLASPVVQNRLVLFGHTYFSATLFVYPLSYSISDIVTEIYGYRVARQMIWSGIFAWLISGLFFMMVIHMKGPAFWKIYDNEFNMVMQPYLRSVLSGTLSVIAGQFLNIYIISKLKILAKGKYFWLRSLSSSICGNVITITLSLLCIYVGRMRMANIIEIILFEVAVDIVYSAVAAFPATFVVMYLKAKEKLDVYDYNINFNPFKLALQDKEKSGEN
jgi:uncharacterized integral membrane protein (TIGR00697 family)